MGNGSGGRRGARVSVPSPSCAWSDAEGSQLRECLAQKIEGAEEFVSVLRVEGRRGGFDSHSK